MLNQNQKKDIKSSLLVAHSHKITFSDINTLFSFSNIKYMCKKVYPYLIPIRHFNLNLIRAMQESALVTTQLVTLRFKGKM